MPLTVQAHQFCGRCGAATAPIAAGGKRQCRANERPREYPRTAPVVRAAHGTPFCY